MNRAEAAAAAEAMPRCAPSEAFQTGLALLAADYPEYLRPAALSLSSRHSEDARMAQLLGLAARAMGDGPLAYSAFRRAAALAPADALIAHAHARTALEAGFPAAALFEVARRLAPNDGSVIQGHAAALVAEGAVGAADAMLADLLAANPLWLDGHTTLAQIRSQHGKDASGSLTRALAVQPANPELHRLAIDTLLKTRRTSEALQAIDEATKRVGSVPWVGWYRAHVVSELGLSEQADRIFTRLPSPADPGEASLFARHAIRAGRAEQAAASIESWFGRDPGNLLWPYASLAWRLTGDARADWLESRPELVGVYDLASRITDLAGLADLLRSLHTARNAPLDQSVRGGTQTDGNLLLRAHPAIQALRTVLLETIAQHAARLPRVRAHHPTLPNCREPQRIAGSWSVRLRDAGFHSDHVHTHGWLSSAFYVSLPAKPGTAPGDDHAGWLALGECRELVPGLAPHRLIEPKPGRLVLFPSTMWHGTRPFPTGERLTVAFDIAQPKQD